MKDNSKWVCTDPDSNQYRRDDSKVKFTFKEDRVTNPGTWEVETWESTINLIEYSVEEMIEACNTFGYKSEEVDVWIRSGENYPLIAECIFELES